jgi:hypothetical protein
VEYSVRDKELRLGVRGLPFSSLTMVLRTLVWMPLTFTPFSIFRYFSMQYLSRCRRYLLTSVCGGVSGSCNIMTPAIGVDKNMCRDVFPFGETLTPLRIPNYLTCRLPKGEQYSTQHSVWRHLAQSSAHTSGRYSKCRTDLSRRHLTLRRKFFFPDLPCVHTFNSRVTILTFPEQGVLRREPMAEVQSTTKGGASCPSRLRPDSCSSCWGIAVYPLGGPRTHE